MLLALAGVTLVSLYPVIALAAANADQIALREAARALIGSVVLALALLLVTYLLVRHWDRAALIGSVALLLFFSYGHVYRLVKNAELFGMVVGRHRYLALIWIAVMAGSIWLVLRKLSSARQLLSILSTVAAIALAAPLVSLIGREFQTGSVEPSPGNAELPIELAPPEPGRDIYYIVVDGYGRQDVLSRLYDYDNSEFIEFLQDRGFYVADQSRSNYVQTALSMASSLNLEYVNDLAQAIGPNSTNRGPLNAMIQSNLLMESLKNSGYQLMAFNTGVAATSLEQADIYLPAQDNPYFRPALPATWLLNPFEGLLLETTGVSAVLDLISQLQGPYAAAVVGPLYQVHRSRILYTLQAVSQVPAVPGELFVFAHVVAPHPPFVFDADGAAIAPNRPYSLFDGSDFLSEGGTSEEYIEGYRSQLAYVNQLLKQTIDAIFEQSDPDPIIVLQADHGPGARLDWDSPADSDLEERFSILNAYYLPGVGQGEIYASITPVNSFRVILNTYFGTQLPRLEDRSYFSSPSRPYRLSPIDLP